MHHAIKFCKFQIANLNDPSVVFQLVQDHLKAAANHSTSVVIQTFELSRVFHDGLSGFVVSHFAVAHAEVNKLIGEALKNAPEGSEQVIESITQAVHVSNQAVHDARDAIRKASELAKQTFAQLHEHKPLTKKPTRRRT
jgi:hypothetical protein